VDIDKLSAGDKVIGISAVVLLLFSFFPWYGKGSYSRNGWHYPLWGLIPILLVVGIVVCMGLQRFTDVKLPDLPLSWEQVYAFAAGIAGVLILLKIIIGDKYSVGVTILGQRIGGSVTLDRKFGIYLAFLAAIGLVVGGIINMSEAPASGDADSPPPPPPPPVPPAPPFV
jgi:hypothetical protein